MTQKIQAELFFEESIDLNEVKNLFHRWLQEDRLTGLFIDVVDYRHVPDGPGVLLAGHEGDIGVRYDGRDFRLTYLHRRGWPVELFQERIWWLIERIKEIAAIIEIDAGHRINSDRIELVFVDRLHFPNRPEVARQLAAALETFAGEEVAWISAKDLRHLLRLSVNLAAAPV